ncbi:MAG: hypothetical protein PHD00_09160 [Bacteroidales bacterium]|nr:hypothetical protein [Bacteroidales bacterium]
MATIAISTSRRKSFEFAKKFTFSCKHNIDTYTYQASIHIQKSLRFIYNPEPTSNLFIYNKIIPVSLSSP